jgi:hypothetical protein
MCSRGRGRAVLACLVVVMALLACTGGAAATIGARMSPATDAGVSSASSTAKKVYWDPAVHIGPAFLYEPTLVAISEDGAVSVQRLRWRGWGSAMANGSGFAEVNNCTPDCASGRYASTPVAIRLSDVAELDGHLIYRCAQVTSSVSDVRNSLGGCVGGAGASPTSYNCIEPEGAAVYCCITNSVALGRVSDLKRISVDTACDVVRKLVAWLEIDHHSEEFHRCTGGVPGEPVLLIHSFDGYSVKLGRSAGVAMSRAHSSFEAAGFSDWPVGCD